jgi:hypothetical protein
MAMLNNKMKPLRNYPDIKMLRSAFNQLSEQNVNGDVKLRSVSRPTSPSDTNINGLTINVVDTNIELKRMSLDEYIIQKGLRNVKKINDKISHPLEFLINSPDKNKKIEKKLDLKTIHLPDKTYIQVIIYTYVYIYFYIYIYLYTCIYIYIYIYI